MALIALMRCDQRIIGAILLGVVVRDAAKEESPSVDRMVFALGATLLGAPAYSSTRRWATAGHPAWTGRSNMLLMTLIFSPIEVLWPAYPKQSVFAASG